MTILKAEKRDMSVNPRKLRREGAIPGVLFGKEMKETIPLQYAMADAEKFFRHNAKGSQVTLVIGNDKVNAIVKDMEYNPVKKQISNIDFQALVAGEKVVSAAQIVLINQEKAKGCIQQVLEEISYKADPKDLVERVEIDFNKFNDGKCIRVEDLDLNKNAKIDILTPSDTLIVNVSEYEREIVADVATAEPAVEAKVNN